MALLSYKEWKLLAKESSAFTRSREAAALGLGPKIPAASVNSRSTGSPFQVYKIAGDDAKKKKAKAKKK